MFDNAQKHPAPLTGSSTDAVLLVSSVFPYRFTVNFAQSVPFLELGKLREEGTGNLFFCLGANNVIRGPYDIPRKLTVLLRFAQ